MTVTVKVENPDEATALVGMIAQAILQIKGVSIKHAPQVGVPAELGAVTLTADEVAAADELATMLGDLGIDQGEDEATT